MLLNFETLPPQISAALLINLRAIQENYALIKGMLAPGTQCSAVLKADAYGTGSIPVAQALYEKGCRHFFFAYLEEALAVREQASLSDASLFVFNGVFPRTEHLFTTHSLIPCLISLEQVERWATYSRSLGKQLPCLLHIDTGMGREGLTPQDFKKLVCEKQEWLGSLEILYLMSHLANSNIPEDPKNQQQLERFYQAKQLVPHFKAAFANSSGIFLGPDYHFDLVRPGMSLYGYKPSYGAFPLFKPALTAYARILLTRTLPAGESVGYGGTFVCPRPTKVALVAAGHAHGILRSVSNRGVIKINGRPAPIIGIVSMDVMMVDITDHPENSVNSSLWAELYGDYESTQNFADDEETSVYELLVRHGKRYYRVYTS